VPEKDESRPACGAVGRPVACAIKRDQEKRGTSLGVFQLAEITRFRLEPAEPWSVSKAALPDQIACSSKN
jgi:hypothetical protein